MCFHILSIKNNSLSVNALYKNAWDLMQNRMFLRTAGGFRPDEDTLTFRASNSIEHNIIKTNATCGDFFRMNRSFCPKGIATPTCSMVYCFHT